MAVRVEPITHVEHSNLQTLVDASAAGPAKGAAHAPRKRRGRIAKKPVAVSHVPVQVVDEKSGPVTFLDKLKAYYHTLITVLGAIVVLLNQVASAVHWIPGYGGPIVGYISAGIVALTALANALKSNEHWVDSL